MKGISHRGCVGVLACVSVSVAVEAFPTFHVLSVMASVSSMACSCTHPLQSVVFPPDVPSGQHPPEGPRATGDHPGSLSEVGASRGERSAHSRRWTIFNRPSRVCWENPSTRSRLGTAIALAFVVLFDAYIARTIRCLSLRFSVKYFDSGSRVKGARALQHAF